MVGERGSLVILTGVCRGVDFGRFGYSHWSIWGWVGIWQCLTCSSDYLCTGLAAANAGLASVLG